MIDLFFRQVLIALQNLFILLVVKPIRRWLLGGIVPSYYVMPHRCALCISCSSLSVATTKNIAAQVSSFTVLAFTAVLEIGSHQLAAKYGVLSFLDCRRNNMHGQK